MAATFSKEAVTKKTPRKLSHQGTTVIFAFAIFFLKPPYFCFSYRLPEVVDVIYDGGGPGVVPAGRLAAVPANAFLPLAQLVPGLGV